MPLTITDFIEQVDGISTDDIPLDERQRINDALADRTGGPGGGGEAGPVNEDAILVSKDLNDRAGFTSIQDAIDGENPQNGASGAGEDDTIFVEPSEYTESVTIDVRGLTLKAADGEKPTVTQDGGTPVLVEESKVIVDDSITFDSGIDVGADFSGYEPGISESEADAVVTNNPNGDNQFNSIGAALGSNDTTVLVKSDYDSSNESESGGGVNSGALIGIENSNVEIISKEGPESTTITGSIERAIDITADNVVLKGFTIEPDSDVQESIFITDVSDATGIEIRDNRLDVSGAGDGAEGIVVSNNVNAPGGDATVDGMKIVNNKINVAGNDGRQSGIAFGNAIFTGPRRGVQDVGDGVIERNTIIGGFNGIQVAADPPSEMVVRQNLFENNRNGVVLNSDVGELSNNHFINNSNSDITNRRDAEYGVGSNWFGTETFNDTDSLDGKLNLENDGDAAGIDVSQWAGAPIDPDAGLLTTDDPPA